MVPISLISPQGHVSYNARFVVGNKIAETLMPGHWYTNQELADLSGIACFLRDSSGCIEKNVKKWRVEHG